MPFLWWVAYIAFGFVIWGCLVAALWIGLAELFTFLDGRRRRRLERDRAAWDGLWR